MRLAGSDRRGGREETLSQQIRTDSARSTEYEVRVAMARRTTRKIGTLGLEVDRDFFTTVCTL